jgi:prepilin-type N-terminal cleavage/methylation domain-containing protein
MANVKSGFTLVEVMMVVAVIGILVVIALPAFMQARTDSQNNAFISDIRSIANCFEMYACENTSYPAEQPAGSRPPEMAGFLRQTDWSERTTIGGYWDWDAGIFGYTAGIAVSGPGRTDAEMTEIDARLDDGDLTTGIFRQRAGGFVFLLEE